MRAEDADLTSYILTSTLKYYIGLREKVLCSPFEHEQDKDKVRTNPNGHTHARTYTKLTKGATKSSSPQILTNSRIIYQRETRSLST